MYKLGKAVARIRLLWGSLRREMSGEHARADVNELGSADVNELSAKLDKYAWCCNGRKPAGCPHAPRLGNHIDLRLLNSHSVFPRPRGFL